MNAKIVCPYCGDSGQIKFKPVDKEEIAKDKQNKPIESHSYYTCFCINNKVVSKSFNKIAGIPDITPEQAIVAGRFAGFKNFLIHGNEQKFLHLVKATMILHANYHHTFEFINGLELVHKYYVQQPPGIFRSLDDLNSKDLLILIFDASPDNKAQNTTVLEVVKNRFRMNNPEKVINKSRIERPTWIYSRTKDSLKQSKEYSSDIAPILEYFTWLDLDAYNVSFGGKEISSLKKRSKAQDIVGKF